MIGDHLFFHGVPTSPRNQQVARPQRIEEEPGSSEFFQWLFDQGGLIFSAYRVSALQRRIPACLRHLGVSTVDEARARMEAEPQLINSTINIILLGVTEFYRDRTVFDDLARLIRERVPCGTALRVWSAATSYGHELYTVAIMLAELGFLEHADLWGTDLRADAIEQARSGLCSPESMGFLPSDWRRKYFSIQDGYYRVVPALRAQLMWETSDLLQSVQPGPWDIVLWRNMAIYLEYSAARPIWNRLHREISHGGMLVTGKAEAPPADLGFNKIAPCIYEKI